MNNQNNPLPLYLCAASSSGDGLTIMWGYFRKEIQIVSYCSPQIAYIKYKSFLRGKIRPYLLTQKSGNYVLSTTLKTSQTNTQRLRWIWTFNAFFRFLLLTHKLPLRPLIVKLRTGQSSCLLQLDTSENKAVPAWPVSLGNVQLSLDNRWKKTVMWCRAEVWIYGRHASQW